MRNPAYLALALVLMLGVHFLPTPPSVEAAGEVVALTVEGKACLGILAFAVVLWVSEALPFAITSLFVILLIPVFGIEDTWRHRC